MKSDKEKEIDHEHFNGAIDEAAEVRALFAEANKACPEEFRKQCGSARCILTWNDPISAVITMTPDVQSVDLTMNY